MNDDAQHLRHSPRCDFCGHELSRHGITAPPTAEADFSCVECECDSFLESHGRPLLDRDENLRGRLVIFRHPTRGHDIHGTVVTRIRGDRWLVESRSLPSAYQRGANGGQCRRITLARSKFQLRDRPAAAESSNGEGR